MISNTTDPKPENGAGAHLRTVVVEHAGQAAADMRIIRACYGDSWRALPAVLLPIGRAWGRFAKILRDNHLLAIALTATLVLILLSNNHRVPRSIFLLAVIPLAMLTVLPFAWRVLSRSVIFWATFVYFGMMAISSWMSPLYDAYQFTRYLRLSALVLTFLIVTAYLVVTFSRFLKNFLIVMAVAAALSALINIVLYVIHPHTNFELAWFRLSANFGLPFHRNATQIAPTYAVFLVGALAILWSGGLLRWQRIVLAISSFVLVVGILLTQARGTWVAVLASLTLLLRNAPLLARKTFLVGVVVLLAVLIGVPALREAMIERGFGFRLEIWQRYVPVALERFWIGYGAHTSISLPKVGDRIFDQPHNLFLWGQIRGGILCGIAVLVMIGASLFWSYRYWRRTTILAPFVIVLTISIVGMFEVGLISTYPEWPWVTFWLPIALGLGTEMALKEPPRSAAPGT